MCQFVKYNVHIMIKYIIIKKWWLYYENLSFEKTPILKTGWKRKSWPNIEANISDLSDSLLLMGSEEKSGQKKQKNKTHHAETWPLAGLKKLIN